jgi:hypothetical protein
VLELFGEEHPLSAKFNNMVMEVLQSGPQSEERSLKVRQVAERNVQICEMFYGERSLYIVRAVYLLYVEKLQEENGGE